MNMDGQDRKTGNAWPSAWVLGGRGDRGASYSFFLCGSLRLVFFFTENLKTIWRAVFFGGEGFDQVAPFACRDTMQRFFLEMESFCVVCDTA
jgi:hypothetical protein